MAAISTALNEEQIGMMGRLLDDPEMLWMVAPDTDDYRLAAVMVSRGHLAEVRDHPSRHELPQAAIIYRLTDPGREVLRRSRPRWPA